jgi:glycosyltransferase involved in cell wall biosynthesis
MIKVCHLTSVHPIDDVRIFIKECSSLAKNDFDVTLIAFGEEAFTKVKNGVVQISLKSPVLNRLHRFIKRPALMYKEALRVDAEIYHLHDPELMPIGLKLKKQGKKVIFDAHEDLPKQIMGKTYLNYPIKLLLSKFLNFYESWVCSKFDAIITATPSIREKFLKINPNTIDINNFPILTELFTTTDWQQKKNEAVYVGGITKIRGIIQIVQALEFTKGIRLNLAGTFSEKQLETEVKTYKSWEKVNELGHLNRPDINKLLNDSKIGLVTLLPLPNHIDAQPNKMFEYMSAGLPVIASNFPLWREIVEGNNCGICVDPLNPQEIAKAIAFLIDNPQLAQNMGANGRKAVEKKYNWDQEEKKMITFYKSLL